MIYIIKKIEPSTSFYQFFLKKKLNLLIYTSSINYISYTLKMKNITNTLKAKNTNISISMKDTMTNSMTSPMINRFYEMVNDMRNFRLKIMNEHENFCHVASIFREDGKKQCFKLRYRLQSCSMLSYKLHYSCGG